MANAILERPEPGGAAADAQREFEFSDADFRHFVKLAYEHAGIALSDTKRNLVYSRLSRRLRALGMTNFRDYREFLVGPGGSDETERFINAISTNLTKFFRESHHFDHFRTHVAVPYAQKSHRPTDGRMRIWSAGCSTGEEPYTVAVVLKRELRDFKGRDVRILATDIDTEVLRKASAGLYAHGSIDEVPKTYREYFPVVEKAGAAPQIAVGDDIKSAIVFRQLNLMEPWPFKGMFDAIFCRNVMIYFDGPTKMALVDRLTQQIKPGGWLYIGHSESLINAHPGLQVVGRTIYRRLG
jgi:chemotaxis protein methyltransferase CheR